MGNEMSRSSRGIRPAVAFLPAAAVLVISIFLFHRHRGDGFDADEFPLPVMHYIYATQGDSAATVDQPDMMPPGAWFPARDGGDDPESVPAEGREEIQRLRSLGYLAGYHDAPVRQGTTVYDSTAVERGYNLMVSGHAPGALLLDMQGEVVHEWYRHFDQSEVWPGSEEVDMEMQFWTRVNLQQDGELLALIENMGIVRLDRDSNLLWASDFIQPHHDFDVGPDGRIYAICKDVQLDPDYNPDRPILDELIVILDPDGHEIRRINIRHALERSPYAPVLRRMPPEGDILHANTIEYIHGDFQESIDPLREGTILLSLRTIDLVCVLDLDTETVYWAESDLWYKQHQPTMLANGNMLAFDNRGRKEHSRVVEIDPKTRRVVWSYRGAEGETFFSVGRGSNQRLSCGNTLITESNQGRAFEVAPDGRIVWEYISPYRAGENRELIGTLFEMIRVRPEDVDGWLNG